MKAVLFVAIYAHQAARAYSFTARLAGLSTQILLAVCVQYYTKIFKDDKWPIHYYAPIQGHELVARRDLIPSEPDHPRAGNWYYKLQLGPLEHKLPPIVSHRWRRVTHHHHQRRQPSLAAGHTSSSPAATAS
jgi:hypothetical protein